MTDAKENESVGTDDSNLRVSLFPDLKVTKLGRVYEKQAYAAGYKFVAGVDEVGRGCLAGPVVAGACILDLSKPLPKGLNDSKQLTKQQREEIAEKLKERCLAYAIGQIEPDEIDEINILQASIKAMHQAVEALRPAADFLLIDAVKIKQSNLPQLSIIRGDGLSASIAAASVLAKIYRDALMRKYAATFPQYGFEEHVGYATRRHLDALNQHGPCQLHRRTFKGVLPESDLAKHILTSP
ncbi:MAG TPA: ribonuclease HII [Pyrinomonadaceae bacterium]|nr:ribonuclease HII [Pyrinomonadaceae bacterium]